MIFQYHFEFYTHRQGVQNEANTFGVIRTVDKGCICFTALLMGLEILGSRTAEKRRMTICIGTKHHTLHTIIRDAFIIGPGAQNAAMWSPRYTGKTFQTPACAFLLSRGI